jgi:hypothetical protein
MNYTINHWMIKSKTSGNSPEALWNDAIDYFTWCEANPIYKTEIIKQTGEQINTEYPRPFNLPALCLHCGVTVQYMNDIARNTQAGTYHLVAQKILQVIYAQNFEYSMVGIFNANMTIRKLDLGKDSDNVTGGGATVNIEVVTSAVELSRSEYDRNIEN